ncbi:SNF2-related protein [Hungatella hathewayi]|uniref:SNF2-related protein n=1 Tax=Hungatella hathewayi TaxID=154046 RepID=UPI0011DDF445|nr:SNF2-related protein [Hungatella hathewayi]
MKYTYHANTIPASKRRELNDKVLYLIDSGELPSNGITQEDLFNAYTGNGGLHELNRNDYDNYSQYSQAKKEVENGQFFTPPALCEFIAACLRVSASDIVADLTCGMGNFYNYLPVESNLYGCELDIKAYKVAHCLYPAANLEHKDIRLYQPHIRFDYVVGNPPFHLRWWLEDGTEVLSQLFYCQKAAALLKPYGILALIVPQSFLADTFTDGAAIGEMEEQYRFLGQITLPAHAFVQMGVAQFPTKLQFWQRRPGGEEKGVQPYHVENDGSLPFLTDLDQQASRFHDLLLQTARADLEANRSRALLELAQARSTSSGFQYQVEKLLYHIKAHPATREKHTKCCEYLHRFYTEKQPEGMNYLEWSKVRLTEKKVLSYLAAALRRQNKKPEQDKIALVKQDYGFVYKAYSAKTRRQLTPAMRQPVSVHEAVLENDTGRFPGYERLLRKKRREYETQSRKFAAMPDDECIAAWLSAFNLWDAENEEPIRLNDIQRHDLNLILQKRYGLLQWEQGSGKTLAGIAVGLYRMERQQIHSCWIISSAISIRNNWNVVLPNYGLSYVFVERLADLEKIRPGDFVLLTLNKVSQYKKQLRRWIRLHGQKIQLVLDESDEITNPDSVRTKACLSCFRRCRMKLLTTGTSTRNNISEFVPQLELLYNNSVNMISWCGTLYHYEKDSGTLTEENNPYYGEPIPAYKRGYRLFSVSHLPEKITVFGVGQRTQDIYNADVLSDILEKTVITRTFEEVTGRNIKHIHQMPIRFAPEEKEVYQTAIDQFWMMRSNYFKSTGNTRKDSMMKLIQQIVLLLRISAAPDTVLEYQGDTPVKIMTALELAADWPDEVVAIGVRHKAVLDSYAKALREYLPDRPLFVVTGSTTTFAKRRALRKTLRESKNGILLCTQQSLPSSVNFEFVNKIILPELHYNNSGMSQFYMRFIRYTSTEDKDIYFLTYAGSIESNLMQMVLVKEKLNLFMKGQDTDLDAVYERFDVDYDLLSLLMYQEKDEKGVFQIRWGKQNIA